MPIVMEYWNNKDGTQLCGPFVRCDMCFEMIEDAKDGNVAWWWSEDSEEGCTYGEIWFTHKQCWQPWEVKMRVEYAQRGLAHGHWMTTELRLWVHMLKNRLKADIDNTDAYMALL